MVVSTFLKKNIINIFIVWRVKVLQIVVSNDISQFSTPLHPPPPLPFPPFHNRYSQTHPDEVKEVHVYNQGELPEKVKAQPGVVKFVSKENGGLGSARNFGINLATGMSVWYMYI